MAIYGDRAIIDVVKPEQELQACGFAASRLTDDRRLGAFGDFEADIVEGWVFVLALVREPCILELDLTSGARKGDSVGLLNNAGSFFELRLVSI